MKKVMVIMVALGALLCLAGASLAADEVPAACQKMKTGDECKPGGGRPVWVRLWVSTSGPGYVTCGSCNTASGCKNFWVPLGGSRACTAHPAKGHKFDQWTANGNWAGDKPTHAFKGKGTQIKGYFK